MCFRVSFHSILCPVSSNCNLAFSVGVACDDSCRDVVCICSPLEKNCRICLRPFFLACFRLCKEDKFALNNLVDFRRNTNGIDLLYALFLDATLEHVQVQPHPASRGEGDGDGPAGRGFTSREPSDWHGVVQAARNGLAMFASPLASSRWQV